MKDGGILGGNVVKRAPVNNACASDLTIDAVLGAVQDAEMVDRYVKSLHFRAQEARLKRLTGFSLTREPKAED